MGEHLFSIGKRGRMHSGIKYESYIHSLVMFRWKALSLSISRDSKTLFLIMIITILSFKPRNCMWFEGLKIETSAFL